MWEAGILDEDSSIELLDGLLVYRDCGDPDSGHRVANAAHDWIVGPLGDLNRQLDDNSRHVRPQATLRLSETFSPIPDIMILRGPLTDYRHRQPTAADVFCLVEVADSSYARDASDKLIAYAAAGVPQYIIVDLRRRLAEVYESPDSLAGTYPPPTTIAAAEVLPLRIGDDQRFAMTLSAVLP